MQRIFASPGAVVALSIWFVALMSHDAGAQGRGAGPSMKPSAIRAIPAETTAAKAKDPNWKAPRTAWGHPDLEGTWTSDDMRGIPTSRPAAQVQTPNEVVISYEMVHDTRVIPLDGRSRIGSNIKQYIGDSRGHFGGDTLVVETTNFTSKTAVNGAPIPPRTTGMEVYSGAPVEGRQPVREIGFE